MPTSRIVLALSVLSCAVVVSKAQADPLTGTLRKVAERGEITIGHRDDAMPFSFLDQGRTPAGFSVEICRRIVDRIGTMLRRPDLKVSYVPVTTRSATSLVEDGTIDLECGTTSNTPARQMLLGFTVTTFVSTGRLLVKANSGFGSLADLDGRSVSAPRNSVPIEAVLEASTNQGLKIRYFPAKDLVDALLLLAVDRVVAVVHDDVSLAGLRAATRSPDSYRLTGGPFTIEPYAIMLRKNDRGLKEVADETITSMMTSGEFDQLYHRWFQVPYSSQGISMNLPMSAELKRVVAKPTDSSDPDSYR